MLILDVEFTFEGVRYFDYLGRLVSELHVVDSPTGVGYYITRKKYVNDNEGNPKGISILFDNLYYRDKEVALHEIAMINAFDETFAMSPFSGYEIEDVDVDYVKSDLINERIMSIYLYHVPFNVGESDLLLS